MGWVPQYRRESYGISSELSIDQVRGFEASVVGVLVDGHDVTGLN